MEPVIVLLVIAWLLLGQVLGLAAVSPFALICQAMSGMVVPVETDQQRAQQRRAVGLSVLAVLLLGVPWALPIGWRTLLACLAVGVGLLFWASRIGLRLEREYLAKCESRRQEATDDAP